MNVISISLEKKNEKDTTHNIYYPGKLLITNVKELYNENTKRQKIKPKLIEIHAILLIRKSHCFKEMPLIPATEWTCVPPTPSSYVEALISNVKASGGGVFGS